MKQRKTAARLLSNTIQIARQRDIQI